MKTSKRIALTSAALIGIALAIPASASQHLASGGNGSTGCADGTVTWSPTSIWPPNHKMQTVTINYTAPADNPNTSDTTTITVDSVVDDQAGADGSGELQGSGQPTAQQGLDWGGVGNSATSAEGQTATTTASVRAERSGLMQSGRTYTITVSCTEQTGGSVPNPGDSGMATLTVTVPHDQGQG
ncbi:MAG TPA: hypothetical protein VFH66_04380 [Mycobacteriales bacterium]|nr:hypothetical protein [Mycobacteriales bacterium]